MEYFVWGPGTGYIPPERSLVQDEDGKRIAGFIRPPIYGITASLLAIGAVNILITLLFAVRERYREFGILKTLGLTPWQLLKSVATTAVLLAAIAAAIGAPLGLVFTRISLNSIGEQVSIGSPFGTMPGPLWIAALALITLAVAALAAALPARRASAIKVAEALRHE